MARGPGTQRFRHFRLATPSGRALVREHIIIIRCGPRMVPRCPLSGGLRFFNSIDEFALAGLIRRCPLRMPLVRRTQEGPVHLLPPDPGSLGAGPVRRPVLVRKFPAEMAHLVQHLVIGDRVRQDRMWRPDSSPSSWRLAVNSMFQHLSGGPGLVMAPKCCRAERAPHSFIGEGVLCCADGHLHTYPVHHRGSRAGGLFGRICRNSGQSR